METLQLETKNGFGLGAPGYCKICDSRLVKPINKKLADKEQLVAIVEWAKEYNESFTRQTLAKHKAHITSPKQTFIDRARKNPVIKPSSDTEFLDAVRDAGFAKVQNDPDSVTISQALKAAQISIAAKQKNQGINIVLVGVMTGRADETIEGEWKEIK